MLSQKRNTFLEPPGFLISWLLPLGFHQRPFKYGNVHRIPVSIFILHHPFHTPGSSHLLPCSTCLPDIGFSQFPTSRPCLSESLPVSPYPHRHPHSASALHPRRWRFASCLVLLPWGCTLLPRLNSS